jgi:hypothetical protein
MIRLLASHSPPSPIGKWSLFLSVPVCRRSSFLPGEGGGGKGEGRGAKSYDRKKAWPSVNHSILSVDSKENRRGAQERSSLYLLFLGAAGLHTQLHSHPKISFPRWLLSANRHTEAYTVGLFLWKITNPIRTTVSVCSYKIDNF